MVENCACKGSQKVKSSQVKKSEIFDLLSVNLFGLEGLSGTLIIAARSFKYGENRQRVVKSLMLMGLRNFVSNMKTVMEVTFCVTLNGSKFVFV